MSGEGRRGDTTIHNDISYLLLTLTNGAIKEMKQ